MGCDTARTRATSDRDRATSGRVGIAVRIIDSVPGPWVPRTARSNVGLVESRLGRIMLLLLATALAAASCGSDDSGSADRSDAPVMSAGVEVDDVAEAAATYTGELGDEGAFAAVVIAFDRGYTIEQLVPVADLAPDGTIEATDPAGQSRGLVDLQALSSGEDSGGDGEASMEAGLQVVLVSRGAAESAQGGDEVEPREAALLGLDLTVGEAQRRAAVGGYLDEMRFTEPPTGTLSDESATLEGYQTVVAMLMLAARGYSAEQIVIALVTDTVRADSVLPACLEVPGEVPEIEVAGVVDCPPLDGGADDEPTPRDDTGGDPEPQGDNAEAALESIPTGLYEGTIDTSTGGFRSGVSIGTATITLQYANGGVLVDWTVSWTEDAGECTTTGTDSWSGSEVTLSDARSFSIRGTRQFQPGGDSTCDLGAEPSSFSRVFRFDVNGATVTSDIGVGVATVEITG